MTTPHRTLREAAQMALDALDAITDDVDGTGLNTMPSFDKAIDAITALREALAAPEPEPVALESVHLTRDTRGMCVVRVNGRVAIRDNGDIIDHMATLEWFAAPPAAPAVPLTIDQEKALSAEAKTGPFQHTTPIFGNDMQSGETPRLSSNRHAGSTPPAAPAPAVPLQGGMDNNELLAAWQKKLPGKVPEGQELNAFAVGTEVGFEHAQRLERMDWDRVHHVLAKHGKHPGRTDDHLADVIDKALSAAPVVPLTDEQIDKILERERMKWATSPPTYEFAASFARAIEAAHGITGGKP